MESVVVQITCPCGQDNPISVNREFDPVLLQLEWVAPAQINCSHCRAELSLRVFRPIERFDSPIVVVTMAERSD